MTRVPTPSSPPSTLSRSAGRWAQALPAMAGAVSVPGSHHCLRGPSRAPRGVGMPREGCGESSAARSSPVKLGLEKGLCSAEAEPASPWGKGWVAAVSSPAPPTTPRSAFSGVLPSQASFPKMQDHLHTPDLRPQLSHLLQQKLHLLGLLRQQSARVPAGTGKQIL